MTSAKKKAGSDVASDEPSRVLSDREARHYQEIRSLEATCDRLEGEYETAKTAASAAKGMWQEAVARLRESIRQGPDPQMSLPIAEGLEHMRAPIGQALSLTDKQAELLQEHGIVTVHDFEDLRSGYHPNLNGVRSLPGVGQATADKWEDEILDWLADHGTATGVADDDDLKDDEE